MTILFYSSISHVINIHVGKIKVPSVLPLVCCYLLPGKVHLEYFLHQWSLRYNYVHYVHISK